MASSQSLEPYRGRDDSTEDDSAVDQMLPLAAEQQRIYDSDQLLE